MKLDNQIAFENLLDKLGQLRDEIDGIDGTPFGKLDRLFDRLAKLADDTRSAADDLDCNMDWEAEAGQ